MGQVTQTQETRIGGPGLDSSLRKGPEAGNREVRADQGTIGCTGLPQASGSISPCPGSPDSLTPCPGLLHHGAPSLVLLLPGRPYPGAQYGVCLPSHSPSTDS